MNTRILRLILALVSISSPHVALASIPEIHPREALTAEVEQELIRRQVVDMTAAERTNRLCYLFRWRQSNGLPIQTTLASLASEDILLAYHLAQDNHLRSSVYEWLRFQGFGEASEVGPVHRFLTSPNYLEAAQQCATYVSGADQALDQEIKLSLQAGALGTVVSLSLGGSLAIARLLKFSRVRNFIQKPAVTYSFAAVTLATIPIGLGILYLESLQAAEGSEKMKAEFFDVDEMQRTLEHSRETKANALAGALNRFALHYLIWLETTENQQPPPELMKIATGIRRYSVDVEKLSMSTSQALAKSPNEPTRSNLAKLLASIGLFYKFSKDYPSQQ